jgi:hypothetical protein
MPNENFILQILFLKRIHLIMNKKQQHFMIESDKENSHSQKSGVKAQYAANIFEHNSTSAKNNFEEVEENINKGILKYFSSADLGLQTL